MGVKHEKRWLNQQWGPCWLNQQQMGTWPATNCDLINQNGVLFDGCSLFSFTYGHGTWPWKHMEANNRISTNVQGVIVHTYVRYWFIAVAYIYIYTSPNQHRPWALAIPTICLEGSSLVVWGWYCTFIIFYILTSSGGDKHVVFTIWKSFPAIHEKVYIIHGGLLSQVSHKKSIWQRLYDKGYIA